MKMSLKLSYISALAVSMAGSVYAMNNKELTPDHLETDDFRYIKLVDNDFKNNILTTYVLRVDIGTGKKKYYVSRRSSEFSNGEWQSVGLPIFPSYEEDLEKLKPQLNYLYLKYYGKEKLKELDFSEFLKKNNKE